MVAPARRTALRTFRRVSDGDTDLAAALEWSRKDLSDDRDRALAAEIVIGTLRWRAALDHAIAWAGDRPLEAFDAGVLDILRISAYQLLHLDRVPASAVVDDAVSLCRIDGHRPATGAVNAILRRISRDRRHVPWPAAADPVAHLSVTWSHPAWLVTRWIARMGFDASLAWARFNNAPAPITLRVHAARISRADLQASLEREGVPTRACTYAPDGLIVEDGNPLRTPLAREGLFAIQDEASQLVGAFAAPAPHTRIVDACAAPGGKAAQLAAALGGTGLVVACDVRARRVRLLRSQLREARVDGVAVVQHDLLQAAPFRNLDAMLVDAPCSGLGTLRRDPDIKWKRRLEDLPIHAERQGRMLENAARAIRPGGSLVYSTCSSEPEENEEVVEAFLERHPAFVLEDPRQNAAPPPPAIVPCLDGAGCLRTSPSAHGLEAFFAARLRRRA
jgi:16S rRNA (cytosine967-C5)-methyltransferase